MNNLFESILRNLLRLNAGISPVSIDTLSERLVLSGLITKQGSRQFILSEIKKFDVQGNMIRIDPAHPLHLGLTPKGASEAGSLESKAIEMWYR